MANGVAIILITALAVLGAYYVVEVVAATTLPKAAQATVVLPYLENRTDMASVLLCAMNGYPGCKIIVCSDDPTAKQRVPFRKGSRVEVLTRQELGNHFEGENYGLK